MIIRLLSILAVVQTALAVYYTDDRPSFGEFSNASLYSLPTDGNILVPDRSGFVQHVANATAASKSKMNGVSRAAAEQTDIMNICVSVAGNPTRTQIFKDRTSCDINGWNTLYTFQALRKYNKFMAPLQMCVGFASGPNRSMMFPGGDCNQAGWTHDFTFWYNQCPHFKSACDGNVYSKNMQVHVYEAFEPHRIMLAPGYDGTKHGWIYKWSLAYMSHFFALSSKGYKLIEERHKPHLSNNVQLQIGGNSYGNVLIPVDVELGAAAIRVALLNSLETGVVHS
ncbi:hypothetical protein BGZ67_008498 [Mortierella alpina]|nr:hypothetical protein BGZ67_008498 [Mortierella alpina]